LRLFPIPIVFTVPEGKRIIGGGARGTGGVELDEGRLDSGEGFSFPLFDRLLLEGMKE